MKKLLDNSEIESALQHVNDWVHDRGYIRKTIDAGTFKDAINLVNKISLLSEEQDHHPKMIVDFSKVTICLITHRPYGITGKDIELAKSIDKMEVGFFNREN